MSLWGNHFSTNPKNPDPDFNLKSFYLASFKLEEVDLAMKSFNIV